MKSICIYFFMQKKKFFADILYTTFKWYSRINFIKLKYIKWLQFDSEMTSWMMSFLRNTISELALVPCKSVFFRNIAKTLGITLPPCLHVCPSSSTKFVLLFCRTNSLLPVGHVDSMGCFLERSCEKRIFFSKVFPEFVLIVWSILKLHKLFRSSLGQSVSLGRRFLGHTDFFYWYFLFFYWFFVLWFGAKLPQRLQLFSVAILLWFVVSWLFYSFATVGFDKKAQYNTHKYFLLWNLSRSL